MSRHDSRAVEAALYLCAVLLALMLVCSVTGCATKPALMHSWGGSLSDYCGEHCDI